MVTLEMIGQFYAKSESILRDDVLAMETGGWFFVFVVEQIIDAGGSIQVFEEVVAVEGEVDDGKTRRVRSRLCCAATAIQDSESRVAGTGVLKFQSGKDFI